MPSTAVPFESSACTPFLDFFLFFSFFFFFFFFLNNTATPEIYPLSLHDALPILYRKARPSVADQPQPTIFPLLLMSQAVLYTLVLSSVPRSCMGPLPLYRKA